MKLGAYALALALVSGAVQAQAPETLAWLRKMQDAAQKLSYSGTFVYQNGSRSETSRITRFVEAGGDIEKLEVMDGVPREIVRTKDTVRCYLPGARLVKVDRRTERGFPALLPERISAVAKNYDISQGETRRIAGYDCQAVVLTPKDNLRYGYRLYADSASGMLLRAVTFDASGEQIEQFMFTQLARGGRGSVAGASRRLGPVQRAARVPQGDRAQAPAERLAPGIADGLFGRSGGGLGVHRVARGPARAGAPGAREHGRDPHVHPRGRQPCGDRGGRGARGERAAHRQCSRVSPSAVDLGD